MKKTVITIIGITGILVTGYAEKADLLKPEYQKKETAVRRLMDEFAENGLIYDLRIDEKINRFKGELQEREEVTYTITLPKEIADKVYLLDRNVKNALLCDFFDVERYSFYAAVLMIESCEHFKRRELYNGTKPQEPFGGIINSDKNLWNFQRKEARDKFIYSYLWGTGGVGGYRISVLYESIPETYFTEIFKTTNTIWSTYCSQIFGANKWTFEEIIKRVHRGSIAPSLLSCVTFARLLNKPSMPLLHEWENVRIQDTQKFLNICRDNDPATKPYLSALMMGLFTVDGYSFNDENGVYTMNERGKMLMDFITEFPIPENATRLQAVMNGGNKEEIQAMMKKHGTGEKWAELLKNPVHPEFAKYPQD